MKTAREIYGDVDGYSFYSYDDMVKEFGTIIVKVDDDNYSGDSRVFYHDGARYGWLQFGWGSCSGCDALQGCCNIDEVQRLMDELYNSIRWWDTREEALKFFNEHDWAGDYSYDTGEQKKFIEEVKKYLW